MNYSRKSDAGVHTIGEIQKKDRNFDSNARQQQADAKRERLELERQECFWRKLQKGMETARRKADEEAGKEEVEMQKVVE